MTPQERQMLRELYTWMQARKRQQISLPLDPASKNLFAGIRDGGLGSHLLTQSISLSGVAENINVPASYAGTLFIVSDGSTYEIPFL